MKIRLNKYLKDQGIASRRKADELIAGGFITVNGEVVTEMGYTVDPEVDTVVCESLFKNDFVYIAYHKPVGTVTSANEEEGRTIFADLPEIANLAYAGRLDKESEGLLLVSNDGQFVYSVAGSEHEKEKEYTVFTDKPITEGMLVKMRMGMSVDNKKTKPAKATRLGERSFILIITEGINRQIRKMAQKVGLTVMRLIRTRVHTVKLNNLEPGKWRYLTTEEIESFSAVKKKDIYEK